MTRKYLWLGLSVLLVAALALSSCAKTATPTQTLTTTQTQTQTTQVTTTTTTTTSAPSTTSTTAAGTPVYGGTLNLYTVKSDHNPSGWDIPMTSDLGAAAVWANPVLEWLTVGDIEKYGAEGSKEYPFNTYEVVPEQYLGGELATSWEVASNPLRYIFHLRKGVMFTGNAKIGMAPRELTADDVVASEKRSISRPGFAGSFTWLKSITATDRYTVTWELNSFFANWPWRIGCGTALGAVMAPETVAAGPTDWHNLVGTGPFTLKDYIDGVGATYVKNPNYWGTTTINGKSYQTPFIDELRYPIITDESTLISAVRTGKIDWAPKIKSIYAGTLASSAPALIQTKYLGGQILFYRENRLTSQYLSNKTLRQALMIGTDLNAIAKTVYGGGEVVSWPLESTVPGYTPLDQMPASQKQLYTYDAAKAKQMIIDAGYPNGFPLEIATATSDSAQLDIANALVDMWSKINVKATIKILDSTVAANEYNDVSYKDGLLYAFGDVNPFVSFNQYRSDVAGATYAKTGEPVDFTAMYWAASGTSDATQRTALIKALNLAAIDDAGTIPFTNAYVLNCYWPWIKNYYGEVEASYYNQMPMVKIMWIDQNMKKNMGK